MADPLATVEKIVKLAQSIKKAAETVRRNKEECQAIEKLAGRICDILRQLQEVKKIVNHPAMSGALEDLAETLDSALEIVTYCQARHVGRRLNAAGDMAEKLHRVEDDISSRMMTVILSINVCGTNKDALDEEEAYDLYCPNCKSCITKRVIRKRRKRTGRQERRDERPKRPPPLEELSAIVSNPTQNNKLHGSYADSLEEPILISGTETTDGKTSVEDRASTATVGEAELLKKPSPVSGFETTIAKNEEEINQLSSEFHLHGTASSSVTMHTSSSSSWWSETGGSSRKDALENILENPNAQPCDLPLQYLREITNDFSPERELGRGGFGVVYKGVLPNGEMVAVKNLLQILQKVQLQEKQFKNEIGNLMRVRHQNIVRFVGSCYETRYECVEYNGGLVRAEEQKMLLCFEYMSNGSLRQYISEESDGLDWQKRYKIIKGICCGLNYLHNECQIKSSVIHLDLKPDNILLDDSMVPKISDFGLARLLDDKNTQTCATTLIGSLSYMSPEYLFNGIISRQADIYSLGVIIIQTITGNMVHPYEYDESVRKCEDFVELIVKNWRNRIKGAPSETDCEQIKRCLEIGLSCIKIKRAERPTMEEIIQMLGSGGEDSRCCFMLPLQNLISVDMACISRR